MEAYTGFAGVYDAFMDDIPYGEWAGYAASLLRGHGILNGLVLDLGCGTGAFTMELSGMGYDMIGVDSSAEMLSRAVGKLSDSGPDILYLNQDMREFELYGTVRAVVSVCDSMNYILTEEELLRVFKLVNNYLDPGGIFLFDLNTVYKYRELLGESVIAENREDGSFIWENFYDPETMINEYDLTVYRRTQSGLYERFEEIHCQRAYELPVIRELLVQAGLEYIDCFEAFTRQPPGEDSERVYFIAREAGKASGRL